MSEHAHHWRIGSPCGGPLVGGLCACGEARAFRSSAPEQDGKTASRRSHDRVLTNRARANPEAHARRVAELDEIESRILWEQGRKRDFTNWF